MARYRITVKISARSAGMVIEPGMSIEIASMYPPITHQPTAEQVNNIFKSAFGVDLKKMGVLNSGYLKVDRIGEKYIWDLFKRKMKFLIL